MATLQLSITYLGDTYHGREWPPAPMRLFQALIAGHQQGRARSEEDRSFQTAMEWLERLPPPEIRTCEVTRGSVCRVFVPNNDDDIAMTRGVRGNPESPQEKAKRYTEKRRQPWFLEGDRTVHYLWTLPDQEQSCAHRVAEYAGGITVLGWGVDMVTTTGRIVSSEVAAKRVFRPQTTSQQGRALRVPAPGSYASVENRYRATVQSGWQSGGLSFSKPPLDYRQVAYLPETERGDQPVACFHLLTLDGRGSYRCDPRETVTLAARLRHAVHERLQQEGYPTPDIQALMGHGKKGDQLAFLPLPTTGHPHADGWIRRIMLKVTEPTLLHRLTWGLDGYELKADGTPVAMLSYIDHWDAVVEQFRRASRLWETITPVVLPGYDQLKARKRKTEKLIQRALIQSGLELSQVQDIWYQPAPWRKHGCLAGTYKTADYMRYPQYHIRVRFRKEMKGPLTLGAGRYFGLGTMVVVHE